MPGSCGAPGSTKVPPTPPGHLWVPFEPGAMAQPGEGWGQRWEHSRMAWGGCVPLGGGACGEAGIDAPPLLPLGISVQFMGGGTARSKQNQNVFLGCSFTPWFTSGGSWGGGVLWGTAQSPPPPKGQGLQRGLPVSLPPTAQSTRKEMPTTSSYRAQPQGPPQHQQRGLLPAAPRSHCCSRSGVQPPAQATSLGGGGGHPQRGTCGCMGGGRSDPAPGKQETVLK